MSQTSHDTGLAGPDETAGPQLPDLDEMLARARAGLLSRQHDDGWWKAELETNVTMDAEDMLLREFLAIRSDEVSARQANWIRSQQRADGTWSNFAGGPADLSTTIEAYVALKLAGDDPAAEHMLTAAEYVRGAGGLQKSRVFTRIWMALFGLWNWDDLPGLAPEQILLPKWVPLNVYDFACWARQTVVALGVVMAKRPVRPMGIGIDELIGPEPFRKPRGTTWQGHVTVALDAVARWYLRDPLGPLHRYCLDRVERWIVDRQEADGGWGGIQPPWVYSLIALHLLGYSLDHPVMVKGIAGLEKFTIEEGDIRRLEACQSPVWDTCLSVVALADAGVARDDPAMVSAVNWLLDEQILGRGDWAVRRPDLAPGGWAFEFHNVNYPDVDDTAEVVMALRCADVDDARVRRAIARGVDWLAGMQSSDGGWAAFDVDNTRGLVRDLPFCDFGEVIDPPSADVTAHVVEMYGVLGRAGEPAPQRGIQWLLDNQEPGGSWFGRWGVNHLYGTGAVLPALAAAGLPADHSQIRRAVRWLEAIQNEDGGWGEDCRSYDDPAWIGRGPSTPSQTGWALMALHAAGETYSDATRRGVAYLAATQLEDGNWDEEMHTGAGFPSFFYIKYHLYRQIFPVMALGRLAGEALTA